MSVAMVVVSVSMIVMIVAFPIPMVAVVLVLAVMVAVIVANFVAVLVASELMFPATMATPVGVFAARREWSAISEVGIVIMVDVPVEADRAAEPGTGANEDAACEPLWAVITEGCTLIRRVIEIAIRADRRYADIYRDLRGGPW